MTSWEELWDSKAAEFENLKRVKYGDQENLKLNGFNHGSSSQISEKHFNEYLKSLKIKLNLDMDSYLYEFGCGNAFFISRLAKVSGDCEFGGSDLSYNMIKIAKENYPEKVFERIGAESFSITHGGAFIIANSVFQYFDDLTYTLKVLNNVLLNSPTAFAFLDIPRGQISGQKLLRVGKNKDTNLQHLLYTENFFTNFFENSGYSISIENQNILGYYQSSNRFNVFGRKLL